MIIIAASAILRIGPLVLAMMRRKKTSIDSFVSVHDAAKRHSAVRINCSPSWTVPFGTSHVCRFHPYLSSARTLMTEKAVAGNYGLG